MKAGDQGEELELNGADLRIAIVQARFNRRLTDASTEACRAELQALGVAERHVRHVTVPGSLELALALNALADSGDFDALVAVGCVIRGETYHFELVANESAAGLTRVSLDHHIPIANAILTVDTEAQAEQRAADKGRDAARVAVEMATLMEDLS